jgi:FHS family L-fucose permease-like MFS transporter
MKNTIHPALIVLTSLFFMWGLITSLNDILIPYLKALFELSYFEAMLIQFCFFGAYFVMSFPSGYLVEKVGYRKGIIIGLLVAGAGCLGFYPAASAHVYALFLIALFVLASGITLLQVAANPYVAILGDPATAASRLNLTQAFNSLGDDGGPVGRIRLDPVDRLDRARRECREAAICNPRGDARPHCRGLCAIPPAGRQRGKHGRRCDGWRGGEGKRLAPPVAGARRRRHIRLRRRRSDDRELPGQLHLAGGRRGDARSRAGSYVSLYWGGAMVGRFIGSAVLRKVRPGSLLAFNAACAIVLLFVTMTTHGTAAMYSVLAVGLFNSIMFPTIFTLGIANLGRHTGEGSGVLCMAIIGGAIVPLMAGTWPTRRASRPRSSSRGLLCLHRLTTGSRAS